MIEDGLYFDLPEDDYHADPALGSTDIKNLLVSPEHYWFNSVHCPDREDTSTPAKVKGAAYHCLLLEGEDAFWERYAVLPSKDDHAEAIETVADLKAWLKEMGAAVGGKKEELIDRALGIDPELKIWDNIRERAVSEAEGRACTRRKCACK